MTPGPRFPLVLTLLLAAAATLSAQPKQTDAFVTMDVYRRVPVGSLTVFAVNAGWSAGLAENVVVEIDVPGVVTSVMPDGGGATCAGEHPVRCSLNARNAFHYKTIHVTASQPEAGRFTPSATITTTTPDANAQNNRFALDFEVTDRPSLYLWGWIYPRRIDPQKPGSSAISLYNDGVPVSNPKLTFTLPEGGTFTGAKVNWGVASCSVSATEVVCTADRLVFNQSFIAEVQFTAPERLDGGTVAVRAVASSNEPDADPADNTLEVASALTRHILVTTIADEGAGSLRQALFDARELCERTLCRIDFRIPAPVPEDGWFTIRPATPLPEVWGLVNIDGATQTAFTGDTNADGPEIEINGSLLSEGDGLVFRRQCDAAAFDLVINGFPRHAIELHHEGNYEACEGAFYPYIARNYLGTDARGLAAVPNERGIVLSAGHGAYIEENLISGNRRAGIFIGTGFYAEIEDNRIGVNAKGEPLGNGASGVFLNISDELTQYGSGADIEDNVIAYNGQWGVCRTPGGEISLTGNAIYGNTSAGIDIGLDNDTPNQTDDSKTTPNKPVLFSASYDPVTNATTIRGRLDTDGGQWNRVDVYASSGLSRWGYAQGEEMVGGKRIDRPTHTDFEIVVPRDLRGKLITATNNRSRIVGWAKPPEEQSHTTNLPTDTSEFSIAIEVH